MQRDVIDSVSCECGPRSGRRRTECENMATHPCKAAYLHACLDVCEQRVLSYTGDQSRSIGGWCHRPCGVQRRDDAGFFEAVCAHCQRRARGAGRQRTRSWASGGVQRPWEREGGGLHTDADAHTPGRLGEFHACLWLLSNSLNPAPPGGYQQLRALRGSNLCEQTECPAHSAASRLIVPHTLSNAYGTPHARSTLPCHFCRSRRENRPAEFPTPPPSDALSPHTPARGPTTLAYNVSKQQPSFQTGSGIECTADRPEIACALVGGEATHNVRPIREVKANRHIRQSIVCQERVPLVPACLLRQGRQELSTGSLAVQCKFQPTGLERVSVVRPTLAHERRGASGIRLLTSILSTVCMEVYGVNQKSKNPEVRHYA